MGGWAVIASEVFQSVCIADVQVLIHHVAFFVFFSHLLSVLIVEDVFQCYSIIPEPHV